MKQIIKYLVNHWLTVLCINLFFLAGCQKKPTAASLLKPVAPAMIVYTNVAPDVTVACSTVPCSSVYNLDLNNDGIADYQFTVISQYANGTGNCRGQKGWGRLISIGSFPYAIGHNGVLLDSNYYPKVMVLNDSISNSSIQWLINTANMVEPGGICLYNGKTNHWIFRIGAVGPWVGKLNSYLGLRVVIGSQTFYGWVRVDVGSSSVVVKDYAYNSSPNQPILAGQTK